MKFSTSAIVKCLFAATMLSGLVVMAQTTETTPTTQAVPHQDFATELAKADLAKQGIAEPTTQQLADSVKSIQDQRASGLGWGQIAASLGLNLGNVVSAANRSPMAGSAGMKGTTGSENSSGVGKSVGAGSAGSAGNSNAGGGMSGGHGGKK